ncbi:MAG: Gfo/Idh/MocA family protein [Candidatus Zipacnadales bacterium]
MELTVGLVGAGAISRPHMRAFVESPYVVDVHVADTRENVRHGLAAEYGLITRTVADYKELLTDETIDVIDICTPHHLHHPIALAALKAGKHVITEKPIALTLKQADEMIAAAKRARRRLFVALSQRMFPAHIKAKQIIDAGEIGKPFLGVVNITGNEFARMNDPHNWKGDWKQAGGGALIDTGYHAVYMLQHFLGPAKTVTAMTKRLLVQPKNKGDDTSVIAFETANGALGSITVTYCATGNAWTESRQIIGPQGSLFITDNPEDEVPLIGCVEGEIMPIKVHHPPNVHQYGVRKVVEHFIECLVANRAPEVTAVEARAALATILAAYRSETEGRRVEVSELTAND